MANIITKPRGTSDLIGAAAERYQELVAALDRQARLCGCRPLQVPMFEENRLFKRGVGESTDIVNKETFDLAPKGDKVYTLRPEFTAGIMRAVIENKLYATPDLPLRLCYSGSAFRYERPQAGRLRELHQWGVEFLDAELDPATVAEAIVLMVDQARSLGLEPLLRINYLGSAASRQAYKAALVGYFEPLIDSMCPDCHHRLALNPLRILDCKVEADQKLVAGAPVITDYLTADDRDNYNRLLDILSAAGVEYELDSRLVRGLDYYTGAVFEIYSREHPELGALGGGGRYDGLVAALGGPAFAGVGFSFGLDRLLLAQPPAETEHSVDLVLLDLTRGAREKELAPLKRDLRARGLSAVAVNSGKALAGALKTADRLRARFFLFVDERGYHLKDLRARSQKDLGPSVTAEALAALLGERYAEN